ncbi:phenylalanine--tRNA ligase subunit beta [Candidatus Woesearchaeota archaeon]|nr:phenylalanine--tRNA ligase subunit beta [Candidatus Woesearchaeota archaeon]
MPTINFSLKDLQNLVGEKISVDKLKELLSYGKAEFENYDKDADEVTVSCGDTNLPYLWSVEGIARLLRGLLGKEKGIPKLEVFKESKHELIVDKSVSNVRPYIAAFIARGKKVDDNSIKMMIDLQEKFCDSYGRRRKKVAIGVYNYKKIIFPITYKATDPESIKFVPLEFKKEMTQAEILEEHPKGKDYAWILEGLGKYPLLVDNKDNVLSFPPIINSNYSGKIEIGDEDLFFEATGEDLDSVLLAANIFAQAFYERGFKVYAVDIKYSDKKITTPYMFNESIKISGSQIKNLTGLELKENEVKKLLEKIRYGYNAGKVIIPDYRRDIMHPVDVIEDVAISYGYGNIKPEPVTIYTSGEPMKINKFIDKTREILIGLGYQEVMSPILSNKKILYENMNVGDFGTIEINKPMSETYSIVRSWLLPILMDVLSKNKHVDYPQKIFEEGIITVRKKEEVKDYHRVALVSAHKDADFTEAKQALDLLMRLLDVKYEVVEVEHDSFIPGRVGRVIVGDVKVGFIGEISAEVLKNWDLNVPVVGFEVNLTELFEKIKI